MSALKNNKPGGSSYDSVFTSVHSADAVALILEQSIHLKIFITFDYVYRGVRWNVY